jgi:hypothetical protein
MLEFGHGFETRGPGLESHHRLLDPLRPQCRGWEHDRGKRTEEVAGEGPSGGLGGGIVSGGAACCRTAQRSRCQRGARGPQERPAIGIRHGQLPPLGSAKTTSRASSPEPTACASICRPSRVR